MNRIALDSASKDALLAAIVRMSGLQEAIVNILVSDRYTALDRRELVRELHSLAGHLETGTTPAHG